MTENPHRCWGSPFTDADITEAHATGRLLTMELELSRICNLRCIYCYAESGEKLAHEISFEEITDVLDQGKALGVRKVIVLGGGEPMAYPRILDVLRAIHDRGLAIELFTNGTLLTGEIVSEFLRLGVHPVIKCNSLKPGVQDRLAGRKGTFEAIRKGFDLLRETGYPTADLSLGAQTIICEQNYDELPSMWRWLRSWQIIPYFECITDQGRAKGQINLAVAPEKLRSLFSELSRIDAEEFGIHWEPKPPVAAFTCRRHLFSCTVTAVGDVIPCPGVDIPAGNIRDKSLREIIADSEVFQNLRNIRQTIKGECRTCDLSRECYGCRGMAYNATGDYLASDPLCWRNSGAENDQELPIAAAKIIPHRESMLLINELVEAGNGAGKATARLDADAIVAAPSSAVDPLTFVELAAQTYAAVKGWEIIRDGGKFPIGYLVGVQKFEAHAGAMVGDDLTISVETAGEFEGFAVVQGSVHRGDTCLADLKIKLWVPPDTEAVP